MLYHPSLQALLAETGLLPWLAPGSADLSRPVAGLIFLETAADCANVRENQLVLVSGQAVRELTPSGLVAYLCDVGAAALVARQPDAALGEDTDRRRLPLVLLPPGTPWTGALEAIQHFLDRVRVSHQAPHADPGDGLLDLAESLSRTTGNPVTVEDPQFAVKAYSSQSGELDPVRVQTILSKRAPESVRTGFEQYGVMKALHSARGPVRIEAIPAMGLNGTRVVVPIRSEGNLLGYIWVIESARRLTDREMQTLSTAADTAAALLKEQQAEQDLQTRLQQEFLRDLVHGQVRSEEEAAERMQSLGLYLGPNRIALALDLGAATLPAQELTTICRTELERLQITGLAAPQVNGAWLLLAFAGAGSRSGDGVTLAHTVGEALLAAVTAENGGKAATARVGLGNPFRSLLEARQSLHQAQSAVALGRSLWKVPRVVGYEELGVYRLLAHLDDAVMLESRSHPVMRTLSRYDTENGTDLLQTLEAYFDCAGNVRRAARALVIHPNTMLYRLQRMADIAGFDPDDSGQRFVLDLEFRLRRLHARER